MDLHLQIDIDGDVTKTTLAQFLADNADDAHLTHDRIVGAIREEGIAIIGGGAAPVVRITATSDVEVYVEDGMRAELDTAARAIMATRPDLTPMSLDEWIVEHDAALSVEELTAANALLALYIARGLV